MEENIVDKIYENQSLINRICCSFCNNETDREDLFQEIVYRVLKSYKGFGNRSSFSTWLYRVSLNTAITFKNKKGPKTTGPEIIDTVNYSISQGPDSSEIDTLYRAIEKLDKIDRAIILLYLEENSYAEIAEITGYSAKNISVKIVRLKRKLHDIYNSLI